MYLRSAGLPKQLDARGFPCSAPKVRGIRPAARTADCQSAYTSSSLVYRSTLVLPRKHCRRCAGFVSLGAQLDSGTRLQLFADVVQEEERSFRKREVGISSIPVGPIVVPGKDRRRSAALVRLTGEFKSPAGTHCRKVLRASGRLITGREMVRFHLRQPNSIAGKLSWRITTVS